MTQQSIRESILEKVWWLGEDPRGYPGSSRLDRLRQLKSHEQDPEVIRVLDDLIREERVVQVNLRGRGQ